MRNLAFLVLVAAVTGLWWAHARRRPLAPLLAERARIESLAELGAPSLENGFLAASYLYGKTRELIVAPLLAPESSRAIRVDVDMPIQPMVSRDGQWIALRDYLHRARRLHILTTASGAEKALIEVGPEGRIEGASWSPDSRSIAYVKNSPSGADLWLFDITQRRSERVIADAYAPIAWSPDGLQIAFHRSGALFATNLRGDGAARRLGSTSAQGGCVEWSYNGKWVAFCGAQESGCDRLVLHEVATGADRILAHQRCLSHIAWSPRSDAIAMAGREQPISIARIASGEIQPLADARGVVKALGVAADGAVLWAATSPNRPYSFWRLSVRGGLPQSILTSLPQTERFQQTMQRLDGPGVPIFRFSRTCGEARERGPSLIWLPCGGIDGTPRWLQEIAYLNLHGITVFMIDVDGEERVKIEAAMAAVARIKQQPDVDELFLFSCCGASALGYSVMVREASSLRGAIDLHGTAGEAISKPLEGIAQIPPLLWMTLQQDRAAASRNGLRDLLRDRGLQLIDKSYDTNHWYQDAPARKQILRDLVEFIRKRSRYDCENQMR